jgi:hypothetical protein
MCMLNVDRMNPYPLDHSLRRLSSLCSDEVQQHGTYPDQKEDRAGRARERSSPATRSHLRLCNWPPGS